MHMPPRLRKLMFTIHITFSVGWLGAVAGFLALAIAGFTSQDMQESSAAYIAMDLVARFVIVPASLGALATGIIQALGTPWGLFRHYWVLVKLLLTVAATVVLLVHMQPVSYLAKAATKALPSLHELLRLRVQLIADAGAALVVLLVIVSISVYKPWGKTRFGVRKKTTKQNIIPVSGSSAPGIWPKYVVFGIIGLVVLFIILHLAGGSHTGH